MAFFTRFLGGGVQTAAGVAIGESTGRSLNPILQKLVNETWSLYPDVPPDPYYLAQGVAQRQVDEGAARQWAAENGIGETQMTALIAAADTGPGVEQAYQLRRRGLIGDDAFRTALKREAIEERWIDPLSELVRQLLSPAELANAVVQGHRSFTDAFADAELQGYTQADFQTMVDNTGLPPGPETLLAWLRRGVVSEAEFDQGIREGHTKTKYIAKYLDALHPLLSAAEWATAHLKGHATEQEMYQGGGLLGYTPEMMDLLYLDRGRPATARQIHIGFARGAKVRGSTDDELAAIAEAVRISDIRPEYTDLIAAGRFTYPSVFVIRGLAQSGVFDQATVEKLLVESGWVPEYARLAAEGFTKTQTEEGKQLTKSELKDSYIAGFMGEAELRTALTNLGYTGAALDLEVLHAEVSAIKTARGAAVTKIRNLYEKGGISEAAFAGGLAALGMHDLAVQRELAYATVVRDIA